MVAHRDHVVQHSVETRIGMEREEKGTQTEDSAIIFVHSLMTIARDTRIERVSSESGRFDQRQNLSARGRR